MKIHTSSNLARWFLPEGREAFAFRTSCYTKSDRPPLGLLVHEAKHVEQFRRYGVVGFLARYVWFQLRYGYERNPLEVEARQAVKEKGTWSKLELVAYLRDA